MRCIRCVRFMKCICGVYNSRGVHSVAVYGVQRLWCVGLHAVYTMHELHAVHALYASHAVYAMQAMYAVYVMYAVYAVNAMDVVYAMDGMGAMDVMDVMDVLDEACAMYAVHHTKGVREDMWQPIVWQQRIWEALSRAWCDKLRGKTCTWVRARVHACVHACMCACLRVCVGCHKTEPLNLASKALGTFFALDRNKLLVQHLARGYSALIFKNNQARYTACQHSASAMRLAKPA